ncbi:Ran GTPase activating protein 1 [Paragonimus heterotremus]|uniref:Ran GTPase activating protein 1 n=1 Tax=Paragonimus heterotremus TaxID=100268 RepID=A0A8J4WEB5_9TREM|nr:Ran GTPase activating protein 1 [Paragonimus heterotremus]
MASGSQLVELDLSDNAFGPNGVVGILELLSSPSCFTLKILRMNNQGLGHEGCRYLTQALQKGRQASNKRGLTLKVFSGGRNRLENVGAQMLSEVFADMGSLEELSLYQNGIGIHGIEGIHALVKILKRNPSLRLLNLSDNNLTPKGGEAIAKSLLSLKNLEELYLSDCILRSTGTQALASALEDPEVTPNLRVLNLTGNEITRNAGIGLILSLGTKSKLELLDLNANEFGKAGVQAIIRTLDSVSLLHTLPKGCGDTTDQEAVADESFVSAFNEDQGSASEDEGEDEDAGREQGNESETGDDDEDEEKYECEDEGEERETSFNTVEERPISKPGVGFSFRQLLDTDTCAASTVERSHFPKPGPFGSGGLFSTIGTDSPDAASIRSKLWPTAPPVGLFGAFANPGSKPKVGGLFAPPLLSVPAVNGTTHMDTQNLETQLRSYLIGEKKDYAAVAHLISLLSSVPNLEQSFSHSKIRDCVRCATPEAVVRLGLQLSRALPQPFPTSTNPISHLAVGLLASVLIEEASDRDDSFAAIQSSTGRAVNCLLVYLGAIKAERDSEDYRLLSRDSPMERKRLLANYLHVTRLLSEAYGKQLPSEVRNCLTLLLSEQKMKEQKFSPDQTYESDRIRDDLLTMLENQFSDMNI